MNFFVTCSGGCELIAYSLSTAQSLRLGKDMRAVSGTNVSVPSVRLLRFLRQQGEGQLFFTANPTTHSPSSKRCRARCQPATARSFTTSRRPLATVESNIFSLDFLRPSVSTAPPTSSILEKGDGHRTSWSQKLGGHRYNSSESQGWKNWLPQKNKKDKEAGYMPPLPNIFEDLGNGSGRSKLGKAGNELKLRCTEIDENGKVTTVNGEFKKSELMDKYGLLPRDLRKIDSSRLPHILVRPSAILINLLQLRILIKSNRVLVLDAYGSTDSYSQSQFMYDLCGKLSQKPLSSQAGVLPYEFRALEAVLISVTTGLESEFDGVSEPVVRVLRELEEDIDRDKLRHLLIYSKKLGTFEQKARLVRDAIDDLLEADDDLDTMYLSPRPAGKENDHTEVEMLLESYHKVCDEIVQESGNLVSNIRNTEEIVKAILDANRNSLMLLDLKFSIGTLGIGSGAFIASLYGMNLKNFLEESDIGMFAVSSSSFILAAIVCSFGLKKLRRVQRVSMWGEHGGKGRGSWRKQEEELVLPEGGKAVERDRRERIKRIKELRQEVRGLQEEGGEELAVGLPSGAEDK